jgi:short-subunit dehydrogenase
VIIFSFERSSRRARCVFVQTAARAPRRQGGTVLPEHMLVWQFQERNNHMTGIGKLALVTGASTGIGLELAKCAAQDGYDLIIAADELEIENAGVMLRAYAKNVKVVQADLATLEGVDQLHEAAGGRAIDVLIANAGRGLGHGFLDQDFSEALHVVNTNITGTIYLIQKIGKEMRARGDGKILITGSIAGFMPGTYQAVYNGTKAFIDSFSHALRAELKDTGVTVTCLMPGATETDFFRRADMLDTKVGAGKKDDPEDVAKVGWKALLEGEGDVVSGMKNKIQSAIANVTPAEMLAEQHRKMAEPGSAER